MRSEGNIPMQKNREREREEEIEKNSEDFTMKINHTFCTTFSLSKI